MSHTGNDELKEKQFEEETNKYRYRINISQSVKGILTFDCTVEMETPSEDWRKVYNESEKMVELLKAKYDVKHQMRMLGI